MDINIFFLAIHNIPVIFFYLLIIYRDASTHKFQDLLKYYKEHLKIGSFSMISISLLMYAITYALKFSFWVLIIYKNAKTHKFWALPKYYKENL